VSRWFIAGNANVSGSVDDITAADADAGKVSQGVWSGLNLSLCAVSLGNVAGYTLPTDKLAEMYCLMAMTVRLYLSTALHFLLVSSKVDVTDKFLFV